MSRAVIYSGLDRLNTVDSLLSGRRVGLMTHPCGYDRHLVSAIDLIHANYHLTALFACEHGIRGNYQAGVAMGNEVDAETGVQVFSLFGCGQRPTREMLDEIDVLVIDLQDVGSRFYTYLYSMTYAIEACCDAGKPVIVLDRINPLGGELCQGTLLDERFHSFVGEYAVPTRHGLTIGEFARFFVAHRKLDVDLTVVPLEGWRRDLYLDDTDVLWTPPSPNMPSLQSALCYPGLCLIEGTNLSEGRGTTIPFEQMGAPFIDGGTLEKAMRKLDLPGILWRRCCFTPTFSKWAGESCEGVQMYVADRRIADPAAAGLLLLDTLRELYPNDVQFSNAAHLTQLLGDDALTLGREDGRTMLARHKPLVEEFQAKSREFYLY